MTDEAMIEAFATARVARLATTGPTGPHIVAIVFAMVQGVVCTAVDHKPKTTSNLRRLRNVADDPRVSVLVDHYAEDWSQLWWIRLDARARVVDATDAAGSAAINALAEKYQQYRSRRPAGPVILLEPVSWTSWTGG